MVSQSLQLRRSTRSSIVTQRSAAATADADAATRRSSRRSTATRGPPSPTAEGIAPAVRQPSPAPAPQGPPPRSKRSKAPPAPAPVQKKARRGTRAAAAAPGRQPDLPFSIEEFDRDFHGQLDGSAINSVRSTAVIGPSQEAFDRMTDEVASLRRQLAAANALAARPHVVDVEAHQPAPSFITDAPPSIQFVSAPNASGVLPPPVIQHLSTSNFPPSMYQTRSGFNPHPGEVLLAHRVYPALTRSPGKFILPSIFVSALRDGCSSSAPIPTSFAQALYAGTVGTRGTSILQFPDLSLSASPPTASPQSAPRASSHTHLFGKLWALHEIARQHWFDHCQRLVQNLIGFASQVAAEDPNNHCVELTVFWVNRYIGRAFAALESDEPSWWSSYHDALASITPNDIEFSRAFSRTLALAPRAAVSQVATGPRPQRSAVGQQKLPRLPDHLRQKIPRVNGIEPCLRFYAGLKCPGGQDTCDEPDKRTHAFPGEVPAEILAFYRRPKTSAQNAKARA